MEKIVGDARLAEQEMGLSTLFLAFGFLESYESDNSEKSSFAPLLLLPVQIEPQKVQGKPLYSVTAREGEAEANLSLQIYSRSGWIGRPGFRRRCRGGRLHIGRGLR